MAPEILQNKKSYNESVDLYSLGMVLYRIMNHMRSPFFPSYPETFDSEDEKEAQKRRLQGETVPLPDAADPAFGKVNVLMVVLEDEMAASYLNMEEHKKELEDAIARRVESQVDVRIQLNETNRPFEETYVDLKDVIHMDITIEDE